MLLFSLFFYFVIRYIYLEILLIQNHLNYKMDDFYIIKDKETGEKYSIIEWVKKIDDKIDHIEDNYCFLMSEIGKVNKLDIDLLELKNEIYRKNEKN